MLQHANVCGTFCLKFYIFTDIFYITYSINQPIRFKVEVEIEKVLLTEPIPYVYNLRHRRRDRCHMEPEFFLHRYPPYANECRHLHVPKRGIGHIDLFISVDNDGVSFVYLHHFICFKLLHFISNDFFFL